MAEFLSCIGQCKLARTWIFHSACNPALTSSPQPPWARGPCSDGMCGIFVTGISAKRRRVFRGFPLFRGLRGRAIFACDVATHSHTHGTSTEVAWIKNQSHADFYLHIHGHSKHGENINDPSVDPALVMSRVAFATLSRGNYLPEASLPSPAPRFIPRLQIS